MTNKELVQLLQELPENWEVVVLRIDHGDVLTEPVDVVQAIAWPEIPPLIALKIKSESYT